MSTKRSRTIEAEIPPGTDNFKLISTIRTEIENRLHRAGILTYDQLAERSPEALAELLVGIRGVSAERIIREKWIDQACALAAQSSRDAQKDEKPLIEPPSEGQTMPKAPVEELEPTPRQRSAIFTLQLELRQDGSVRRTLAKHARPESGDEEAEQWPGWDAARLALFIEQRAGVQGLQNSISTAQAILSGEAGQKPASHAAVPVTPADQVVAGFSGEPALREFDIIQVGDERPHLVLPQSQPFQVRLALDLADVVMPDAQPISYAATVLAKRMGTGTREQLGEARGQLAQADSLTVDIPASGLPEGLYRLEALVDLGVASEPSGPQHTLITQLKGGMLQIY